MKNFLSKVELENRLFLLNDADYNKDGDVGAVREHIEALEESRREYAQLAVDLLTCTEKCAVPLDLEVKVKKAEALLGNPAGRESRGGHKSRTCTCTFYNGIEDCPLHGGR